MKSSSPVISMVSMDDVAVLAGVSKATVSRVFNGNAKVAEETRRRVVDACTKLNYKINSSIQDLARKGKSGSAGNVAFVLAGRNFSDPAYSRMLDPMAEEVNARNLHLMLVKLPVEPRNVFDLPPVLRDNRVDGVLITGALTRKITEVFEKLGIPTIVIGEYSHEILGDLPQINYDLPFIYRKAIDYAFQHGVTRLAMACESRDSHFGQMLYQFYRDGLKRWNVPFDESLVFWGSGINRGVYPELKEFFQREKLPFDGILVGDYRVAGEINNLYAAHCGFSRKTKLLLIWERTIKYQILMDENNLTSCLPQLISYSFELLTKIQKGQIVPKNTNI